MIRSLLTQWSAQPTVQPAMLCSLIEWKGSVPRKDYPMMLVLEDGSILGTIGGGSMELKVTHSALEMLHQNQPQVFDFEMTGKDVNADVGLCGGEIKVLVEPFTEELQNFYQRIQDESSSNPRSMVKLSIQGVSRIEVQRDLITSTTDISETDQTLESKLRDIFKQQRTKSYRQGDMHYLLWQSFQTPTIHIFGAGHVGQAVAELAHFNELDVQVYDDRLSLLTEDRFPYAQRLPMQFPVNWEDIPVVSELDFILIASREHKHDRDLLAHFLRGSSAYIGLVSSARKWKLLSEHLHADGFEEALLSQVHAPVGLNIDAQTVPEIAISIVAEIISIYRGPAQ